MVYLLHSRTETGYLLIDSCVFSDIPHTTNRDSGLTDKLLVFQRVCRFAIKRNSIRLSVRGNGFKELEVGAVPLPVKAWRSYEEVRLITKPKPTWHAHLYAFASGTDEAQPVPDQLAAYKRAFEDLGTLRPSIYVQIKSIEETPGDQGYHPLVLSEAQRSPIRFQSYDKWLGSALLLSKPSL